MSTLVEIHNLLANDRRALPLLTELGGKFYEFDGAAVVVRYEVDGIKYDPEVWIPEGGDAGINIGAIGSLEAIAVLNTSFLVVGWLSCR